MKIEKIKASLQDLINRLQDAEKGYKEIRYASSNIIVNKWLDKYAAERHSMHRVLEEEIKKIGGVPEVNSTFLGELHRMFIDIKINHTTPSNEFTAIVDEIERGSNTLLDDYQKVLDEVLMPPELFKIIKEQKALVQEELNDFITLRNELNNKITT